MKAHKKILALAGAKLKNNSGGSLIEMVIVIVFIGIVMTAIMTLYTTIAKGSSDSYVVSQATILAQGKLEDIISDRNRQDRGYVYITAPGRYPVEVFEHFTISTFVEPDNHEYNSVSYGLVKVTVSHPSVSDVSLFMWLTKG